MQGGNDNSNEGGNSSTEAGAGGAAEPATFEPLDPPDPPPPALVPPGAAAVPGIKWTALTAVNAGHLDGALVGDVTYDFHDPSLPDNSPDWLTSWPFVWMDGAGMQLLDRLLPDVLDYNATFVTSDGNVVTGRYFKNNEAGVFRWTRSDGAIKIGPARAFLEAVESWTSDDGNVIVVNAPAPAPGEVMLWTAQAGEQTLSDQPDWPAQAQAWGLSGDGSTIVGTTFDGSTRSSSAFRWTAAKGTEPLGNLPGQTSCSVGNGGISRDGKVLFGACSDVGPPSSRTAFRWTEAGGLVALETPDHSCVMSYVALTTADGSVAFGVAQCGSELRLMRWSADGTTTTVPASAAPGFTFDDSYLLGIDAAGASVCGSVYRHTSTDSDNPRVAFRWGTDTGYVTLPQPNEQGFAEARAIDRKGHVMAGVLGPLNQGDRHAVLWDSSGILDVAAYLTSQGVDLQNHLLFSADEVFVKHNTLLVRGVGGVGAEARDWIARIPRVR